MYNIINKYYTMKYNIFYIYIYIYIYIIILSVLNSYIILLYILLKNYSLNNDHILTFYFYEKFQN